MFTVTPLHLEIVMHYYTNGDDIPNLNAPAVREYLEDLKLSGMIEDIRQDAVARRSYRTTERGRVWLNYLLTVPFPEQAWVMRCNGDPRE